MRRKENEVPQRKEEKLISHLHGLMAGGEREREERERERERGRERERERESARERERESDV